MEMFRIHRAASFSCARRQWDFPFEPCTGNARERNLGVELIHGDLFYGELVDWQAEFTVWDTPLHGRVRLRTQDIRRVFRWNDGNKLLYVGPNGHLEWTSVGEVEGTYIDRGHVVLNQPGVALRHDVHLAAMCRIDLELAWANKPRFVIGIGVDETPASLADAVRLEVWEDDIVICRETETDADVAAIGKAAQFFGELQLTLFLDQTQGKTVIYKADGEQLASISVPNPDLPVRSQMVIKNQGGPLRLKKLSVLAATELPAESSFANQPRIHRTSGVVVPGTVRSFDAQTNALLLDTDPSSTVPLDEVSSIRVQPDGAVKFDATKDAVRLMSMDGVTFSGQLQQITATHVILQSPSFAEPISFPIAGLRTATGLDEPPKRFPMPPEARHASLTAEGIFSDGYLVGGNLTDRGSCLVWQPIHALHGSPLRKDLNGRIVYREPALQLSPQQQALQARQKAALAARLQAQLRQERNAAEPALSAAQMRWQEAVASIARTSMLYLRQGDVIPAKVQEINEQGVVFESTASQATFVPHEAMKAIDFGVGLPLDAVAADKRERLLTIPRAQRKTPPSHVVVSITGDCLRGRLVGLNEDTATIETRFEPLSIPRSGLSQIIWFPAEELPDAPAPEKQGSSPNRVQAVCRNGVRLTFEPEQASLKGIMGTSASLGTCHVAIGEIDVLLLGNEVSLEKKQQRYHNWRFVYAPDPKVLSQSDTSELDPNQLGVNSPLIGGLAPEVLLPTLDEKWFNLREQRGKVLCWISGPPGVDRVSKRCRSLMKWCKDLMVKMFYLWLLIYRNPLSGRPRC